MAAATSTFFVNTLHVFRTSKFRKASGVKYPAAYASAEEAAKNPLANTFNCGSFFDLDYLSLLLTDAFAAQRAHANFTENQTSFLGALLISGLHFPVAAAVLGGTWAAGRVVYLYGYTSSAGPSGRVA